MWILDELKGMRESDRIAIIHRNKTITFKELWLLSEKIATYHNEKLKTKNPIIIYANKEIEATAIMLGTLKSGRAYVFVDTTFPQERVGKIAKITKAEIIYNFSGTDLSKYAFNEYIKIIKPSEFDDIKFSENKNISESEWVKGDDLSYILFTSGSTGEPKGVGITKNNIINFIEGFKDILEIDLEKVSLNQVSYSFDISGIQFYYYLACGETLFNIDSQMTANISELFAYLNKSKASSWVSTPSFIEMCVIYDEFNSDLLPHLSKIILAGEVLTKKLARELFHRFPKAKIYNGYGPSEVTIFTSACEIKPEMLEEDDNLPIGKVIKEATYWLEKNENFLTPNSEEGELIVASNSVCKGYYMQPELTMKSFFEYKGKKAFRTKDLVYKKGDMLYFKGRTDFQIKLNGYRIELEDIECNMNKVDIVAKNVVLPIYKGEKISYLHAFVLIDKKVKQNSLETKLYIKNELKKKIPSYMVPRKITILDKFPINSNGKVDRKKIIMENT